MRMTTSAGIMGRCRYDAGLRHGRGFPSSVLEGQGRALRMLALHSPVSQKELAYLLGIRSQSLAELMGKLEKSGFIVREPDPNDRRTSMVSITESGRQAAENRTIPAESPFAVLNPDEQSQLAGLLDRVIDALEEQLPRSVVGGYKALANLRREWLGSDMGFGTAFPWDRGDGGGAGGRHHSSPFHRHGTA